MREEVEKAFEHIEALGIVPGSRQDAALALLREELEWGEAYSQILLDEVKAWTNLAEKAEAELARILSKYNI